MEAVGLLWEQQVAMATSSRLCCHGDREVRGARLPWGWLLTGDTRGWLLGGMHLPGGCGCQEDPVATGMWLPWGHSHGGYHIRGRVTTSVGGEPHGTGMPLPRQHPTAGTVPGEDVAVVGDAAAMVTVARATCCCRDVVAWRNALGRGRAVGDAGGWGGSRRLRGIPVAEGGSWGPCPPLTHDVDVGVGQQAPVPVLGLALGHQRIVGLQARQHQRPFPHRPARPPRRLWNRAGGGQGTPWGTQNPPGSPDTPGGTWNPPGTPTTPWEP